MSKTEAEELGIEPDDRFQYFRVDNGKSNMERRTAASKWRQMKSVTLNNGKINAEGDSVGVATPWALPSAFNGVTAEQLDRVMGHIESDDWRADMQCANWVGLAVMMALGMNTERRDDRARVRSMINIWLKNGVLQIVQKLDNTRRMRAFVTVGKGV